MVTRTDLDARAQRALSDLKARYGTWQGVSDNLHGCPNKGQLQAIYKGKRPAPNSILIALGLPLKHLPAPACKECGAVHVAKRCPEKHKATGAPAPRRNWKALSLLLAGLLVAGLRGQPDTGDESPEFPVYHEEY